MDGRYRRMSLHTADTGIFEWARTLFIKGNIYFAGQRWVTDVL